MPINSWRTLLRARPAWIGRPLIAVGAKTIQCSNPIARAGETRATGFNDTARRAGSDTCGTLWKDRRPTSAVPLVMAEHAAKAGRATPDVAFDGRIGRGF